LTTFIDYRYLRALAAALFTGQEKEELDIVLAPACDNYLTLDVGSSPLPRTLARFVATDSSLMATLSSDHDGVISLAGSRGDRIVTARPPAGEARLVGLRISQEATGLKTEQDMAESTRSIFGEPGGAQGCLRLECSADVRVMGRGSGRAMRWGELFYKRREPRGLCVELTMDWHHLRAGIPLFSTMTAEELVAEGKHRLRFRSYAYDDLDAEAKEFVRLFSCTESPEVAVHLTPSLYIPNTPGIPNLAFGVTESKQVHPHIVDRCNTMDCLVVPSSFARDAFARNGVLCPIEVVSHGVDAEYFRPAKARRPLPGGRAFNFLAVGTQVERKNFNHLVRAFLEEFRAHEDVALFLLLRPEYHTTQYNVVLDFVEWERQWSQDSAQIFIWTGYLTREHLRDFYAHANAYVMPSNEGFGLTLLEAMACGTPAIGLRHGGVLDFLNDHNGILVPTGKAFVARDVDTLPYVGDRFLAPNVGALRSAMRHLFEAPADAARLGKRARADTEELAWSEVTQRFSEIIRRTHEHYHAQRKSGARLARRAAAREKVSLVLCVQDDEGARISLKYLRGMARKGFHVLCLFTRYARPKDLMRARKYGFVNYRWDGTLENGKVIARSIFGRHWITILHPGEKIIGDSATLWNFLLSQPPEITAVSVRCRDNRLERRMFLVGSPGGTVKQTRCMDVSIG